MRRRVTPWSFAVFAILIGILAAIHWFGNPWQKRVFPANQQAASPMPLTNQKEGGYFDRGPDLSLPKLPETSPPPGLPIIVWGKRDHFPVIRNPEYWTAQQGDKALARDEPVLGVLIGVEAWAYSTNHLNDHEMLIDTLAGTPVLVSY